MSPWLGGISLLITVTNWLTNRLDDS